LKISGILPTMVNERTNDSKEIICSIKSAYGNNVHIFDSIPRSVTVSEASKLGCSIYKNTPNGKVAGAYQALTMEVVSQ